MTFSSALRKALSNFKIKMGAIEKAISFYFNFSLSNF
jgi:hypothetical protein